MVAIIAGNTFIYRKQLWKITRVYPDGKWIAAVRWIKSTQKWSGNAYLHLVEHVQ